MLRPRLLPDDEPCAPVAYAARLGCVRIADEKAWPVLRSIRESTPVPNWNTLGRAVSIMLGDFRYLRPCLLPVHLPEPRAGGNGDVSGALPVVELLRKRAWTR